MKAVIFDLDGVLADTHEGLKLVNEPFWKEHGIPEKYWKKLHGLAFKDKIRIINHELGKSISAEHYLAQSRPRYMQVAMTAKPLPGAVELVKALKQRGILLALATSASPNYCREALAAIGLHDAFSIVLTSHDVERPKPDPEIYQRIAAHFKVSPHECVVIDDSPNCLRAARAVGMRAIGVLCSLTTREELAPLAERVVANLSELTAEDLLNTGPLDMGG